MTDREQDDAQLALLSLLTPVIEEMATLNAAVNAPTIGCPACFLDLLFTGLALKYNLHMRSTCDSDEEFLEKATLIYTTSLKDLLHATTSQQSPSHPSQTHRGSNTPH